MKLTSAIQESIVVVMCYDDAPKGGRFIRQLVPPQTLDPYYREIAAEAEIYMERYSKVPGEHTLDIIEGLKARNEDAAEIYDKIFASMEQTRSGVNSEYVLTQASLFARQQRLKRGITQAISLLKDGEEEKISEAEALLHKSLKHTYEVFHTGIRFSDPKQSLSFLDEELDASPTGIEQLDRLSLGPIRKGLHLFVAAPNAGKTWWLVTMGKHAMMHRETVVHVTLEMGEPQIAQRYAQALFSVSKREARVAVRHLEADELGRFVGFDESEIVGRPHFADPDIKNILSPKIRRLAQRPPLIIRQFPPGQLTPRMLEDYLDTLEGAEGIIPDLLIIDYADDMSIDKSSYRHSIGEVYKALRAIGVERNIRVATASQANREGEMAQWIRKYHMAEAQFKENISDTIITFSQTDDEYKLGLGRLLVDKARSDVKSFALLISQAIAVGQFSLDAVTMNNDYWRRLEAEQPEEVEVEEDD